jgi:hypothetical protein
VLPSDGQCEKVFEEGTKSCTVCKINTIALKSNKLGTFNKPDYLRYLNPLRKASYGSDIQSKKFFCVASFSLNIFQCCRSRIFIPYPGCLSRIQDVYPGSWILIFTHHRSRIPDPKTAAKERGE